MSSGKDVKEDIREGFNQKVDWRMNRIIKFDIQNRGEDRLNKEFVAGSKDEKISVSIKTWL